MNIDIYCYQRHSTFVLFSVRIEISICRMAIHIKETSCSSVLFDVISRHRSITKYRETNNVVI